jgi:hypothetical protein
LHALLVLCVPYFSLLYTCFASFVLESTGMIPILIGTRLPFGMLSVRSVAPHEHEMLLAATATNLSHEVLLAATATNLSHEVYVATVKK